MRIEAIIIIHSLLEWDTLDAEILASKKLHTVWFSWWIGCFIVATWFSLFYNLYKHEMKLASYE